MALAALVRMPRDERLREHCPDNHMPRVGLSESWHNPGSYFRLSSLPRPSSPEDRLSDFSSQSRHGRHSTKQLDSDFSF